MFSKTIKYLLDLCNLKIIHLSNVLNYDLTYISKWLTEERLPSIKNNGLLFNDLAVFFIENSTNENIDKIKELITKEIELSDDITFDLSRYLRLCYEQQKIDSKKINNKLYNSLFEINNTNNIIDIVKTHSNEMWINKDKKLEIFSSLNILETNNSFHLIELIKWFISKGKRIHLVQMINVNDMKSHIQESCNFINFIFSMSNNIEFSIIESTKESNFPQMLLLDKNIVVSKLDNYLNKKTLWLFSKDSSLIKQHHNEINLNSQSIIPIIKSSNYQTEKVLDYYLEPNAKYILTSMQPLYMDIDVLNNKSKDIFRNQNSNSDLIYKVGIKTNKKVVIFKSTIIDYFTNHQIELYGQDVNLNHDECALHLKYIAEKFRDIEESELYILNNSNPITIKNFDNLNIYMNNKTLHVTKKEKDSVIFSFLTTYKPLVDLYNQLFDSYVSLPSEHCLSGSDSIEYISNLSMFLE